VVRVTGRRDEHGFVVVLVALSLLVILVLTALVVDLGQGRQRRRSSQNAADAAALASVQELPDGPWQTAGEDYVNDNDFDASVASLERGDWDDSTETFTTDPAGECVEAVTEETGDSIFGGVVGDDEITVRTSAVACMTVSGGSLPALFAGSPCAGPGAGQDALKIQNGNLIQGGFHSNGDVTFGGAGGDPVRVIGDGTYVNDVGPNAFDDKVSFFESDGVTPADDRNPRLVGTQPFPFEVDIADYQPGGAAALAAGPDYHNLSPLGGNAFAREVEQNWVGPDGKIIPGIYYTSGAPRLPDLSGDAVMFVAQGEITASGGTDLDAYDDTTLANDIVLFSNAGGESCGNRAIRISGSDIAWTGVLYAPHGQVDLSGARGSTFDGSIVAWEIDFSGSDLTVISSGSDDTQQPVFELVD
jgi:hypothetical protein